MKHPILILCLLLCTTSSCYTLKFRKDKQEIKWVAKNKDRICAAADSLLAMANGKDLYLDFDTLGSPALKKKFATLNNSIKVSFGQEPGVRKEEPGDSIITFDMSGVILGSREIIFDFSKQERSCPNNFSDIGNYLFIQVAPKIYYRRRPVPMM